MMAKIGNVNLCWTPTSDGANCSLVSEHPFSASIVSADGIEQIEVEQDENGEYYATEFIPDGSRISAQEVR